MVLGVIFAAAADDQNTGFAVTAAGGRPGRRGRPQPYPEHRHRRAAPDASAHASVPGRGQRGAREGRSSAAVEVAGGGGGDADQQDAGGQATPAVPAMGCWSRCRRRRSPASRRLPSGPRRLRLGGRGRPIARRGLHPVAVRAVRAGGIGRRAETDHAGRWVGRPAGCASRRAPWRSARRPGRPRRTRTRRRGRPGPRSRAVVISRFTTLAGGHLAASATRTRAAVAATSGAAKLVPCTRQ